MKTAKQSKREAKKLFQLCLVGGSIDDGRAREVVRRLIESEAAAALPVLSRFERLTRLDRAKHSAAVTSAAARPPDVRAQFEAGIARAYGPGIVTTFAEDAALIGGVRVTVGSDVYDGTIRAGLAALEARL